MPALARLAGKRVRSSECLLNNETVSKPGVLEIGPCVAELQEHGPSAGASTGRD